MFACSQNVINLISTVDAAGRIAARLLKQVFFHLLLSERPGTINAHGEARLDDDYAGSDQEMLRTQHDVLVSNTIRSTLDLHFLLLPPASLSSTGTAGVARYRSDKKAPPA